MTQEQATKTADEYKNIVGQRWRNIYTGTIETVTEVNPIEIWKQNDGWTVIILFIPTITNHIAQISGYFLETFLENYKKFN
jgi:hypothetical protein